LFWRSDGSLIRIYFIFCHYMKVIAKCNSLYFYGQQPLAII
jgi:hypothetical protein